MLKNILTKGYVQYAALRFRISVTYKEFFLFSLFSICSEKEQKTIFSVSCTLCCLDCVILCQMYFSVHLLLYQVVKRSVCNVQCSVLAKSLHERNDHRENFADYCSQSDSWIIKISHVSILFSFVVQDVWFSMIKNV